MSLLGACIALDTHDAPVAVEVRVDELRLGEAERIAADPGVLASLEDGIADDARGALVQLALWSLLVAIVGGALGALVASARVRSVLVGGVIGALVAVAVGGSAALTFDEDAVAEPRYSGLLTVAPKAVGDLGAVVNRFGQYRAQLTELVGNVAALYQTAQGLPTLATEDTTTRVLHVSDIHLNPQAFDLIDLVTEQFDIDVIVDTGDTTDWGTAPETRALERISSFSVPYVWVRGNHDSRQIQDAVAATPNAVVLDGAGATVAGLRFWGVGDPRYTPEKDKPTGKDVERDQAEAFAPALLRMLRRDPTPADVVLVHDARMAARLGGVVPLVLSGHTHKARESRIGATRLLVEGSTGGSGLRGLQKEQPVPLTCSVL